MPTILRFLSRLVLVLTLTAGPGARAQQMVEGPYQNGMWSPVAFAFHDDDILYVCSRYGLIYVFDNGVMQPNLLLDISEEVNGWRDFGLLGFALDPDFDTNGYYYVSYVVDRHHLLHYGTPSYSSTMDEPFNATIVRVTRFTADAATGHKTTVPGSRFVLFGETPSTGAPVLHESHSCGQLLFGRDGTLLVAIGDGAHFHLGGDWGHNILSYDAQAELDGIITPVENTGVWRSQQLSSCSGKILRLDPATGDGVPSNPFYDSAAPRSARSRIYALGFRNPFRMSLRPGTGSTDPSLGRPGVLYVGDVGWLQHEELDVVSEAGQNFGWPMFEGIERRIRERSTAVYAILERDYGESVERVEQELQGVVLDADDAANLGAQAGAAALRIVRRYYSAQGRLLEVAENIHPSDRFSYRMELRK